MSIEILFINSPLEKYPINGRMNKYLCIPPYGLLYCATVCINILGKGAVAVLDAEYEGLSPHQIKSRLDCIRPRYIAINVTSINLPVVKEIISLVNRDHSVIVGGAHAILSPRDFFDSSIINKILFVCTDNGESVYHQFFTGIPIEKISNICYFDGSRIIEHSETSKFPIDNIIPSRDLLPYDPNCWEGSNIVESYMVTSRGCPYSCAFCAANVICKNKILYRSIESITKEFNELQKRGVNYIRFIDDLFMSSAKRLRSICNCILSVGWTRANFGFEATGRIDVLSKIRQQEWALLRNCGCKELEIGVESGSERIRKKMNKIYQTEELYAVVRKALENDIKIKAFIICGYINENTDDLTLTLHLCMKLKEIAGNRIRFSAVPAKAYPKTVLYNEVSTLEFINRLDNMWFCNARNIDLANYFGVKDEIIVKVLSNRTRYNSLHVFGDKPLCLSEISGGSDTDTVLKALCDIALISRDIKPIFFNFCY